MREITDLQDQEDLALDDALEDADAQEIQGQIMERMATFNIEMEDLQEIQGALDIPIMEQELEMDHSEEERIMADMAASDMDEGVDIESEVDIGSEDIDIEETEAEIDIESEEIEL